MARDEVDPLIAALHSRLGRKGVTTEADELAPWLTDWRGRYTGSALALVSPASTEEVAAIVSIAADYRVPVVPQGGNTGMVGGATPPADGRSILLSLRRMNRIRSIDTNARTAIVDAGVILQSLHEAVAAYGLRFPLTLGARGSATIGGLVSTNAGGTQVLRWGTMRALVIGIEAVLPPNDHGPGGVWNALGALKKDNRGYAIDQLLIGAEGTLGIVTAARLRLVPALHNRTVAWAAMRSPHDALTLLRCLETRSDAVEGFEIIPGDSLQLVVAHIPGARAPVDGMHAWHVLIELVDDATAALENALARAIADGLVKDAVIAASEAQAEAFWRLRDTLSEAERAAGPAVQHDISVPVDAMPDFIIDAARQLEAAFAGATATAFGHLGDGNVHLHVRAPKGVEEAYWRGTVGAAASAMVHDLVTAAGGSISAEHGIGQTKRDELARLADPIRLATLHAIKAAIDPLGLMNPGKLL